MVASIIFSGYLSEYYSFHFNDVSVLETVNVVKSVIKINGNTARITWSGRYHFSSLKSNRSVR